MYPPELITQFEEGILDIREFDHKKHVYIAYFYLNRMPRKMAIERYCKHLQALLDANGYGWKFSREITENYINKLDVVMKQNPESSFDQLVELLNQQTKGGK